MWETMHFRLLGRTRRAVAFGLAVIAYRSLYPKYDSPNSQEKACRNEVHGKVVAAPMVADVTNGVARVAKFCDAENVVHEATSYVPYFGKGTGAWYKT